MAMRMFPWGTVSSTPSGVSFSLSQGLKFEVRNGIVMGVASYTAGNAMPPKVLGLQPGPRVFPGPLGLLYLEWDPWVTVTLHTTARSVLKIGRGSKAGNQAGNYTWSLASGTTLTLLNRNEAKELTDALLALSRPTSSVSRFPAFVAGLPVKPAPFAPHAGHPVKATP